MTEEERQRLFKAQAAAQARRLPKIQRDTIREILAQLEVARGRIAAQIGAAKSIETRARLSSLKREIERTMTVFRVAGDKILQGALSDAWRSGIELTTKPFEAAGVVLQIEQQLNPRTLVAMREFLTDRIKDISSQAVDRINGTLAQVLAGAMSQSDAITRVQQILGGAPRSRAATIAYTEIGRAYAIASHAAMLEAAKRVPGMAKRWVKSGKLHPRPAHVLAHNQIVRVAEKFIVDGEAMDHPRDPNASAGNTINCGCMAIPVVSGSRLGDRIVEVPTSPHERIRLLTREQRQRSNENLLEQTRRRLAAAGIDTEITGATVTTSHGEVGLLDQMQGAADDG